MGQPAQPGGGESGPPPDVTIDLFRSFSAALRARAATGRIAQRAQIAGHARGAGGCLQTIVSARRKRPSAVAKRSGSQRAGGGVRDAAAERAAAAAGAGARSRSSPPARRNLTQPGRKAGQTRKRAALTGGRRGTAPAPAQRRPPPPPPLSGGRARPTCVDIWPEDVIRRATRHDATVRVGWWSASSDFGSSEPSVDLVFIRV